MEQEPKSTNPNLFVPSTEQGAELERRKTRLRRLNVITLLRQRNLRRRETEAAWRQRLVGLMLATGFTLRASLFSFGGSSSLMRRIHHNRFKSMLSTYSRDMDRL